MTEGQRQRLGDRVTEGHRDWGTVTEGHRDWGTELLRDTETGGQSY